MDFQPSNTIVNGYFYSFTYTPPTLSKGYDRFPLVFVTGPSTKSLNNLVAINLHHLPLQVRENFIAQLQRVYDFMNKQRIPISKESCYQLVNGVSLAEREYNKKYIKDCVRIDPKSVPLYIFGEGHISQESPSNTLMKWIEKRGLYHIKEKTK